MNTDEDVYRDLTLDESWDMISGMSFGRLAFAVAGVPEIVPINYCVSERKLYFRTSEGSKLAGLTINHNVAFEIDTYEEDSAASVILSGTARELQAPDELAWADTLPLRPWVPTLKYHFVEITPDVVTGRLYRLGPEPER
ncbi:MAG TPA: pyridoxamine 5'-phosphate oxidase family protein [Dermatophilaceae bacterium]|nr:pyridoxamine 5'-phosphate oxidase family protein [Dermatophilaceae bacterium]